MAKKVNAREAPNALVGVQTTSSDLFWYKLGMVTADSSAKSGAIGNLYKI